MVLSSPFKQLAVIGIATITYFMYTGIHLGDWDPRVKQRNKPC